MLLPRLFVSMIGVAMTFGQASCLWAQWRPDSAIRVQPSDAWLWQIDHPLLTHSSYLVGIIHQMPASQFFFPPEALALARRCDRLVLAVDPNDPPRDLRYRSDMPLDSSLEALLPAADYQGLARFVRDSLSALVRFKLETRYPPSVLARELLCEYCLQASEEEPPILTEYYVRQQLADMPLGVVGTGWSRVAWLDHQPLTVQVRHLMHVWRQRRAQCEIFQAMLRAYRRQDLDRMWLYLGDLPDFGANTGRLIEARNQTWMAYLRVHLPDEPLFLAVMAGQLPGEYGLLHRLRKSGYQVSPLYSLSPWER